MRSIQETLIEWAKVNPVKNILHLGAHTGDEINFYSKLNPETIYWFEPNPELQDQLKRNLSKYSNINSIVFPFAVSSKAGKMKFNLIYSDDMTNTGCSSLRELKHHKDQYPHIKKIKEIEVDVVQIDNFLLSNNLNTDFDLISMDIQGSEYDVLESSEVLFSKKLEQQAIVLETSEAEMYEGQKTEKDLTDFLSKKGYMKISYEALAHNWGDTLYAK